MEMLLEMFKKKLTLYQENNSDSGICLSNQAPFNIIDPLNIKSICGIKRRVK